MEAFKTFYRRNKDKLFAYLMRATGNYYLSSDIMQESFTRCLEKYKGSELSSALLFTIARNCLYDQARKDKYRREHNPGPDDSYFDQESNLLIRDEYKRTMAALEKMESMDREILALAAVGALSYQEIAEIMDITVANVKVRVHRARISLRSLLREGSQS